MPFRVFVSLLCFACAVRAAAAVPSPTIEGPVTGGRGKPFLADTTFDLASVGWTEAEYFLSGTATAFTTSAPLGSDGLWIVTPGATAAYKTRIVVHRPTNPKRFHGTVVVEWLNVSGGIDAPPDWLQGHDQMLRDGIAWVGVSAQIVGVEGGTPLVGAVNAPLKKVDPARYGSLHHPGDSFSYDMFSQVAAAIRNPSGPDPLGGLRVKKIIAAGESQSAFRMVTYIDAIQPVAHEFDGFLVHSRAGVGAPLSEAPQPDLQPASPTFIRSDVGVPVLTFQTQTDVTFLEAFSARQDDTSDFRLWEVAGTSHVDAYLLGAGLTDVGKSPDVADLVLTHSPGGVFVCPQDVNSGPQHFGVDAAVHALDRWVRRGKLPPTAPRLDVDPGPPLHYVLDAHGNATGGVRTPAVDAPLATFTGQQEGSLFCLLYGTTTPFDAATLKALYPTHRAYTSAVNRSARHAVHAGFLTGPDARLIEREAAASDVGR